MLKLNLGCGPVAPEGWVNVDYSLGARFARLPLFRTINKRVKFFNVDWDDSILLHDLTTSFPFEDASVDVVYSSHTLEHLSKAQGEFFIGECARVLRDDGVIRIIVPDLRYYIDEYEAGRIDARDFVAKLGVLFTEPKNPIKKKVAPLFEFPHRCMYDEASLVDLLASHGFKARARHAFDSEIGDIDGIELAERTLNSVVVEGKLHRGSIAGSVAVNA